MGNNLADRVHTANNPDPGTEIERPAPTLAGSIRDMQDQFALAMPRGMEAAQLVRDAITALRTTRNLSACDRASVLGGLMTCAQLGLRPGVLGHAWLLPFWDKNLPTVVDGKNRTGGYRAQLIIGYQGYRELGHRSGLIDTLIGRTVHKNDMFDIDYGLADNLIHKPRLDGDRGDPVGYYAIVKYTSGGHAFWHMSKAEVELHRDRFAMAKTRDGKIVGPWRDNFDEMAVKTAFLRLAKWMPKSTEMAAAIEADETVRVDLSPDSDALLHGEHPDIDGELVDDTTTTGGQDKGGEPS
jgi:recombination protein RecT